jgi:Na+-driven multidrug efflux pump
MKIKEIFEAASDGATSAANIGTMPMQGGGSSVGTLFGGSYGQKTPAKRKPKTRKESIIRR